ncbi:MAG: hypothetical protein A07HB70_01697 [uncultured archaeon A07HB70]|nr:MAG: hypothetical protein A07HB70_01697 [uncultured archaeon A07HB70]
MSLGTTYPSRVLLVNPPPASGSIRTGPSQSVALSNATAADDETDDFLNASANGPYTLATRPVTYQPGYNVYDSAPTTTERLGTTVNENPDGNDTAVSGQTLVEGNEITLVAVEGNLSRAQSSAVTVDPRARSASTRTIPVSDGPDGNLTLTVPTTLSADRWRTLLGDEYDPSFVADGHVYRVAEVPGEDAVNLSFDGGVTYRLRTALVGVGSLGPPPGPAYVTTETDDDGVTVEVRDRYNNPVPNSRVSENLTMTSNDTAVLSPTNVTVGEDGQAAFDYAGTGTASLTLVDGSGTPVLDATNGSAVATVTSSDVGSDTGGGGDGAEINPVDGVIVTGATIVNQQNGQGNGKLSAEVKLTFENRVSSTRSITQARLSFYQVGDPGTGPGRDTPPKSVLFNSTSRLVVASEGGGFESVGPTDIGGGGSEQVTLKFYNSKTGGDEFDVDPGDFFVITVEFKSGETATYFVAPEDS